MWLACRVLIDHGVDFVIIGGMAARLHDTGHPTIDVDICPSLDDANLSNLADARGNSVPASGSRATSLAYHSIRIRPCCGMWR